VRARVWLGSVGIGGSEFGFGGGRVRVKVMGWSSAKVAKSLEPINPNVLESEP
jgi:hypothetical protein